MMHFDYSHLYVIYGNFLGFKCMVLDCCSLFLIPVPNNVYQLHAYPSIKQVQLMEKLWLDASTLYFIPVYTMHVNNIKTDDQKMKLLDINTAICHVQMVF